METTVVASPGNASEFTGRQDGTTTVVRRREGRSSLQQPFNKIDYPISYRDLMVQKTTGTCGSLIITCIRKYRYPPLTENARAI